MTYGPPSTQNRRRHDRPHREEGERQADRQTPSPALAEGDI